MHRFHIEYNVAFQFLLIMTYKFFLLLFVLMLVTACIRTKEKSYQLQFNYPKTVKVDTVDRYFGTNIADPYRWLEDDLSAKTKAWIKQQNKLTYDYLQQIPYREQIKNRLTSLWDYEKSSAPFTEGQYTYFYKNDGLQDQYVLYRKRNGKQEVFLDPNTFSEDGTVSLAQISFSRDGSMAVYSISESGSDWRKAIVIDVETKEQIGETLTNLKFSALSWYGNEGFYYSRYDQTKDDESELSATNNNHKLYYHQLGTQQLHDNVVFGAKEGQQDRYVSGMVTEDDRYLVIMPGSSSDGNKLYVVDLHSKNKELITVLDHAYSNTYVIDNVGSKFYLVTDLNAPNKKIVTVDINQPDPENWVEFIAETEHVLLPSTGAGYFYIEYMEDAVSMVKQYDYQGQLIRNINLPGMGNVTGLSAKKEDEVVYYSFTNYIMPKTIYSYDPKTGVSDLYMKSKAQFDSSSYVSKQVFYHSKDGTKIPMIITHKKGIKLDSKNPTILYGYGGFNVSLTPSFGVTTATWLEMGGIYAVANLRGGGEYGKKWHEAGIKMNKQNVFDDFIAAAEYLIDHQYTSSQYLAVKGGSNGGLLVGAVMTQRPNLFQVALPSVGVLDMLRYHKFTIGAVWSSDYGTVDDSEEMFNYLLSYSPLHHIEIGVDYPATLILTGDHDDRVVPAHSYKFAAELQAKGSKQHPLLIRINTDAGHGAGTPVSKVIDEYADVFAFTLHNMGIKKL